MQEVVRLLPQARVQRNDEQSVDVPFPQITEDIVEEFKTPPQGQFSVRICEQIVDVPLPRVDVREITDAIEALQFQVRAMSNEIQRKCSSKEEFLTKKHGLKMQLNEEFQKD